MSTTINTCLQNVIGLSRTPCDCWAEKPSDYNTSDSGFYLDEMLGINQMSGLEDCSDEDVWTTMETAREQGIKNYMTDMKAMLSPKYESVLPYYKGKVGEAKATALQGIQKSFAGLVIRCNPIRSGYLKINGMGAKFNATGTKHIYVYDNLGNLHDEFDINTQADVYTETTLSTAITLPLYSDKTAVLYYYFFYADTPGEPDPYMNSLTCQYCGGFKPCWDMGLDCFNKSQKNDRYRWARYINVSGFQFDSTDEIYNDTISYNGDMFGLTLDVETYCSVDDLFCYDTILYTADQLASAQAKAILYCSTRFLADKILLSDKLTRSTMINRDTIREKMAEWKLDYERMTAFIAENIDVSRSGCLRCRERLGARTNIAIS